MSRPLSLRQRLEAEPWHTALGLASMAVWQAQQAVDGPADEAIRALVIARCHCSDAAALVGTQEAREMLAYLTAECDALATKLGFVVVGRAAA